MPQPGSIRAGRAFVELFADDSKLVRGLKRAEAKVRAFGESVRNMGLKLAGLGAAVVAPMLGAAKSFASMGDNLAKMSRRTGFSVESLSELGFAAELSGTNIGDLENSIRRMQKSIAGAADEAEGTTGKLDKLGLSAEDVLKLAPEDQFKLIADRLAAIQDPTLKAAAAMEIFGRSGTSLLPMLAGGAAGIEALQEKARKLGLTISTADAKAAEEFDDTLTTLWRSLKMVVFSVGASLAPVLTQAAEWIGKAAAKAREWVEANKGLIVSVLKLGAYSIAAGAGLVVLGTAIKGVAAAIGILRVALTTFGVVLKVAVAVLGAILTPAGMVVAVLAAIGATALYASGYAGKALKWLGERFAELKADATAAWQGIGAALAKGDIALAAKILWLTLKLEFQKVIQFLLEKWTGFKKSFLSIIDDFVYGGQVIWADLVYGMTKSWLWLGKVLKTVWADVMAAHATAVNQTSGWIAKKWLWLQKLMGEPIDLEFAEAYIDKQVSGEQERINRDYVNSLQASEDEKAKALAEAKAKRDQRLLEIGQADAENERKRSDEYAAQLAANEKELADTRQAWLDAIAEAKATTAAAAGEGVGGKGPAQSQFLGYKNRLAEVSGSRGTFSAMAVRGLMGGEQDRVVKAIEDGNETAEKMLEEMQRNAPSFT